jgi:hypothetical protein
VAVFRDHDPDMDNNTGIGEYLGLGYGDLGFFPDL